MFHLLCDPNEMMGFCGFHGQVIHVPKINGLPGVTTDVANCRIPRIDLS